ncbi:SDR family oxidoreductase [Actinophytocola gossypii]|uniref:NmrA family NAD(P)-binding protein n=1 Tax=Actinophytocola gossypii TaxID=2812003 RepID=A0ABT2JIG3_9PSEU|nr:NmrA family NAD(P)-binding protein [Actinophytocola gossypii]MCT2587669.1 NmrA family NAD(P)-binding protein [Actinophytocola gossypii]
MILVTGGTGTLGRAVVTGLRAAGHTPRVLSRRGDTRGDLRTGAGLPAALAGVETVVHCATSLRRHDLTHAANLVDAARGAGRPHVVFASIVGVDTIPLPYYRTKLAVERMLASSGLPWTVLRATQFHDLVLRLFTLQRWSPALLLPAGTRFQPVDVRDVAARLIELAAGGPAGRVPDFGGPEVRRLRDLARAYTRRPLLPIPLPGKVIRGYRTGANLAEKAGTITFEQYLEDQR